MTREEATDLVESAFDAWEYNYDTGDDWSKEHTALDMAIKALEEPSVNETLDKLRAEIQKLRGCSCSCSDGIIDDVEDILDKLIEIEDS